MAKKKSNNKGNTTTVVTAEAMTGTTSKEDSNTVNATYKKNSDQTSSINSSTVHTEDVLLDDDDDDGVEEEEEEEEEIIELLQVDVGDMIKVKQVLDECVAMILLDYLPENTMWDNIKLTIMTCACIAAVIAQTITPHQTIHDVQQRMILVICGIVYFSCSTLLQYITTFIDQDTIIYTHPITPKTEEQRKKRLEQQQKLLQQQSNQSSSSSSSSSSLLGTAGPMHYKYYDRTTKSFTLFEPNMKALQNPYLKKYPIRIRTVLPRYSQYYTVMLQFDKVGVVVDDATTTTTNNNKSNNKKQSYSVSMTYSIGQFFDKLGYFDEIGLANAMEELLWNQLDMGQYNKTTTTTTTSSSINKKQD